MTSLSLISLNIERDKHLDLVVPFLREHDADVVCIQELLESDIPALETATGAKCFFVPMTLYPRHPGSEPWGIGIFSRVPVLDSYERPYAGREGPLVEFAEGKDPRTKYDTQRYTLAVVKAQKDGQEFLIATTHFLWTPDGEADDFQRTSVQKMLESVRGLGEVVLCGDFNAPRGKEIFTRITEHYKDNIPPEYQTSLDIALHRAGKTAGERLSQLMVDGLFTTPAYAASEVKLVSGVSDHCAMVATISKL